MQFYPAAGYCFYCSEALEVEGVYSSLLKDAASRQQWLTLTTVSVHSQ